MNKYTVIFSDFSERYYIKAFKKKYKTAWDKTQSALYTLYTSFDILFQKSVAETIINTEDILICKTEFSVAGTGVSPHASGNRCIVAIHKNTKIVHVLLVYTKTDIRGHHETVWWQKIIRDNYLEYKTLF